MLLSNQTPADLDAYQDESVAAVDNFRTVLPKLNQRCELCQEVMIRVLAPAQAVPIFWDGAGRLYGLDLFSEAASPAVYFFDHEGPFDRPRWAASPSLGRFLLLPGEQDQALEEGRTPGWEREIDPDIDKCPRAPPIWRAG